MSLTLDFLTPTEIAALTGCRRRSDQRAWLTERAWIFEADAKGRPKVMRAYAVAKRGGTPEAKPQQWQPDFSDLAEAG